MPEPSIHHHDEAKNLLGQRVRAVRKQRQLTLEKLAQAANLSKGHLSRFERGEKTVSVAALVRLAQALHTSTAALLGEPTREHEPLFHRITAQQRQYQPVAKGDYEFAALSRADGGVDPTAFFLRMSERSEIKELAFHSGEELFFVVSGALEIQLDSHSMILKAGDYLQFLGVLGHRLRGIEPNTEVLVIITGQNEK